MKKLRTGARSPKCERLDDRRMLAADLGIEHSSFMDTDPGTAEVSSMDASGTSMNGMVDLESTSQSDVVLDWNNLFHDLLIADEVTQNPGYASRSMAMLNLAIYDAVSIASGDAANTFYDYSLNLDRAANINAEIAASEAAYTVLSGLYPDQQATIDAFYQNRIASYRVNSTTADSLAVGTEIGNAILAARAGDGSDAVVEYTFTDEIGYFQADPLNPDVPVWGPGWGEIETFAISAAEDFAPVTTPPITSEEYAASYNEVFELGSVDSTTRTADQTEAGIFWAYDREGLGTPMALFSNVLEAIAIDQGNTLAENAALFAQASVAMADAGIVAWHTKFSEEFWRPVTAIHAGDSDGNDLTAGDTEWTALGAPDGGDDIIGFTPQFPTYISGHATFGGALFGAIREFYGTDDIAFSVSSHELELLVDNPELQAAYGLNLDDATRSFSSLSEAMAENGRSRVYLGIHFDFDDTVGQDVGQAVAAEVATEFVVASDMVKDGSTDRNIRRDRGERREGPRRSKTPSEPVGDDMLGSNVDPSMPRDLVDQATLDADSEAVAPELAPESDPRRRRGDRDRLRSATEEVDQVFTDMGDLESDLQDNSNNRRRSGRRG